MEMDITTRDTLIYWQTNRESAHYMMMMYRDEGDHWAAIQWQEYHAYCHLCFMTNMQKAGL